MQQIDHYESIRVVRGSSPKIKRVGESEAEIIQYEEPTLVEFSGRSKMGTARHLFSLTAEGESKTRVDQMLEMRPRGMGWLFAPLMGIMLG